MNFMNSYIQILWSWTQTRDLDKSGLPPKQFYSTYGVYVLIFWKGSFWGSNFENVFFEGAISATF